MTCRKCGGPLRDRHAHRCQKCYRQEMAERNRNEGPQRMRENNPVWRPEVRAKISNTLRAMRHHPPLRGGNGRPLPIPQQRLAAALGWPTEYVVATRAPRDQGLPTNYKIDIANPQLMIAVEVDGNSHVPLARRQQDRKKEAFLASRGWKVLRFSNEAVMQDLNACVQTVMSTISKSQASTRTPPTA